MAQRQPIRYTDCSFGGSHMCGTAEAKTETSTRAISQK